VSAGAIFWRSTAALSKANGDTSYTLRSIDMTNGGAFLLISGIMLKLV
jgi:hypothetical protein